MTDKLVTPKFLTQELAKLAVESVLSAVMKPSPVGELIKRQACHIVILAPAMKDDREADYPDWPNYALVPQLLYEQSVGDRKDWTAKYDDVARCKALQLWHERNDDRSDIIPHLLFPGDAPVWGGVRRHGIIVACAGIQCWFDKMIAGMTADMLIGLAYNAWMTSDDKKNNVPWLT
jgi:hypothetical protein